MIGKDAPKAAPKTDLAHSWRVRFQTPDGYFTFVDIGSPSGPLIPKDAALAWGRQEAKQNPKQYACVSSAYSIDHEA